MTYLMLRERHETTIADIVVAYPPWYAFKVVGIDYTSQTRTEAIVIDKEGRTIRVLLSKLAAFPQIVVLTRSYMDHDVGESFDLDPLTLNGEKITVSCPRFRKRLEIPTEFLKPVSRHAFEPGSCAV